MPSVAIARAFRTKTTPPEAEHALRQVDAATSASAPFAHTIVRDFLPADLFDALREAFPASPDGLLSVRERRRDPAYSDKRFSLGLPPPADPAAEDLPAPVRTLQRLLTCDRMVLSLLARFEDVVTPRLNAMAARSGRDHVTLHTSIELIYDCSGFSLVPHTDGAAKLVTGLLYVAEPDDPPELGTRLYEPLDQDFVSDGTTPVDPGLLREAGAAPYEPNLFLCFARSGRSFHGVDATASDRPRRLVQCSIMAS